MLTLPERLRNLRYEYSDEGDDESAFLLDCFIELLNRIQLVKAEHKVTTEAAIDMVLGND